MARGWESKAVEDQMEEALRRSQDEDTFRVQSPELIERRRRIENLRLARSRLTVLLSKAPSAAHQQMIRQSLRAIEAEIAALTET